MSDETRTFAELGVSKPVVAALAQRDVEQAFPIQEAVIEAALDGRDICGKAPTGSGKTLAFGVPTVDLAGVGQPWTPTALILSPTRELASQIRDELAPLAEARSRRVQAVFGGTNIERDIKRLEQGVDILVACPGRLEDLISRRCVELRDAGIVVVDEADRMADMGFLPSVKRILDQTPDNRHTMLFSATLDGDVDALINRYQRDPLTFEVDEGVEEPGDVEHSWHLVDATERIDVTAEILRRYWSSIVFCRTRRGCDRVAKLLVKRGLSAVPIHGDRSQAQRERALREFTSGKAQVLVATDVAARGIHVDDVELVLHYDPANTDKDHVHRSGRTGRAGRDGRVISLVVSDKEKLARQLQRDLGVPKGFTDIDFDSMPDPAQSSRVRPAEGDARDNDARGEHQSKSGARTGGRGRQGQGKQSQGKQSQGKQRQGKQRQGKQSQGKQGQGNQSRDKQRQGKQSQGKQRRRKHSDGNQQRSRQQGETRDDASSSDRSSKRRRRGANDWYPKGWDDDRDEQTGGSNTTQRKSRSSKGRHADRDRNRNRGRRRGPRRD